MTTHDEHSGSLLHEVMNHAPDTLTSQELAAAMVFAADVMVFEPGHPFDRVIRKPLDDPMFQRDLHVSGAAKVRALAQALAAKGVLEPVEERNTYRIAHLNHLPKRGEGKHP